MWTGNVLRTCKLRGSGNGGEYSFTAIGWKR